jgi:hypothetical protein
LRKYEIPLRFIPTYISSSMDMELNRVLKLIYAEEMLVNKRGPQKGHEDMKNPIILNFKYK